jgi:osmotically-inducible protein OsmY
VPNTHPNHHAVAIRFLIAALLAAPAFAFIAGCSSTATTDTATTARVKTALLADPGLKSLAVSVETYRGAVQLSGFVNSEVQIQKAVAVTRGVSGVQSVNNDLHVKPQ